MSGDAFSRISLIILKAVFFDAVKVLISERFCNDLIKLKLFTLRQVI